MIVRDLYSGELVRCEKDPVVARLVCALGRWPPAPSSPETTPSPQRGGAAVDVRLNPDGSTLKVTAPTGLSPNGGVIDTRRPTLTFTNATAGVFTPSRSALRLEVQDAAGAVVYAATR